MFYNILLVVLPINKFIGILADVSIILLVLCVFNILLALFCLLMLQAQFLIIDAVDSIYIMFILYK